MKTIKEVLGLTVENIEAYRERYHIFGICSVVHCLFRNDLINSQECSDTMIWLHENLPYRCFGRYDDYSWPKDDVTSRINWMLEKIKELS